jgi:cytochrome b6-f complex iron-sulfur subunit
MIEKTTLEDNSQNENGPQDLADVDFTRRGFVKVAIGAVGCLYAAAVAYPVYKYLNTPVEDEITAAKSNSIDLKDADKLPPNSTLTFRFKSNPAVLIHFADGTWAALNTVCTHLGCTVQYTPPAPEIVCACHGGRYDPRTGKNISGPPPRPLTTYNVHVAPGKVTVST